MRARRNDGSAADAELAAAAAAVAAIKRRWRPERAAANRSDGGDANGAANSGCSADCWSGGFLFSGSPGPDLCRLQYSHSVNYRQHNAPTASEQTRWAAASPPWGAAAGAEAIAATGDSSDGDSFGQQTANLHALWYGAMAPLDSNAIDGIRTVQYDSDAVGEFGGSLVGAGFLRSARRAPPPSAFESLLPQQRLLVTSSGALSPMQSDVAIPLTVTTCESPCCDADVCGNASLVPTTVLHLRVSAGDCCCYLTSGGGGGGWFDDDGDGYDWLQGGLGLRVSHGYSNNEMDGAAVSSTTSALPCPQPTLYTPRVSAAAAWQSQASRAPFW